MAVDKEAWLSIRDAQAAARRAVGFAPRRRAISRWITHGVLARGVRVRLPAQLHGRAYRLREADLVRFLLRILPQVTTGRPLARDGD